MPLVVGWVFPIHLTTYYLLWLSERVGLPAAWGPGQIWEGQRGYTLAGSRMHEAWRNGRGPHSYVYLQKKKKKKRTGQDRRESFYFPLAEFPNRTKHQNALKISHLYPWLQVVFWICDLSWTPLIICFGLQSKELTRREVGLQLWLGKFLEILVPMEGEFGERAHLESVSYHSLTWEGAFLCKRHWHL